MGLVAHDVVNKYAGTYEVTLSAPMEVSVSSGVVHVGGVEKTITGQAFPITSDPADHKIVEVWLLEDDATQDVELWEREVVMDAVLMEDCSGTMSAFPEGKTGVVKLIWVLVSAAQDDLANDDVHWARVVAE